MDPLALLRDYAARRDLDKIIFNSDDVLFADYTFPANLPTAFASKQSGRPYPLSAAVFLAQHNDLKHTEFLPAARLRRIPPVSLPDRKTILEVRDKPASLKPDDWARVVAVFVLGKERQFKAANNFSFEPDVAAWPRRQGGGVLGARPWRRRPRRWSMAVASTMLVHGSGVHGRSRKQGGVEGGLGSSSTPAVTAQSDRVVAVRIGRGWRHTCVHHEKGDRGGISGEKQG
ncbi:LOW QUALITY PROTEIN: hypothetical protein CFC21_050506 [Triticum aestivum]|uniref:Paf1 complex subunit Cdc73 N-terminal domain-containing protein n=2 Tax=Triticum aestivum TaxID=4565 RepID=A0A3B6H6M0_WHEAT|nr:LOW QUALITY PROTEIN: hypothetical protein CFC21_050506 [Triticum aestivum]